MGFRLWKKIPKETDREKEEELRQEPLEKSDIPAMLLAAFFTVFLPVALIVLVLGGLCLLLFTVL